MAPGAQKPGPAGPMIEVLGNLWWQPLVTEHVGVGECPLDRMVQTKRHWERVDLAFAKSKDLQGIFKNLPFFSVPKSFLSHGVSNAICSR